MFAGPACQEVFGGKPFAPVDKESACHLSERQQKLALEYQNDLAQLRNRYINGEETRLYRALLSDTGGRREVPGDLPRDYPDQHTGL